jgi:hypothetical protein
LRLGGLLSSQSADRGCRRLQMQLPFRTNRSNRRGARRISAWATLDVAQGNHIRRDAWVDMPRMHIALLLRLVNKKQY